MHLESSIYPAFRPQCESSVNILLILFLAHRIILDHVTQTERTVSIRLTRHDSTGSCSSRTHTHTHSVCRMRMQRRNLFSRSNCHTINLKRTPLHISLATFYPCRQVCLLPTNGREPIPCTRALPPLMPGVACSPRSCHRTRMRKRASYAHHGHVRTVPATPVAGRVYSA